MLSLCIVDIDEIYASTVLGFKFPVERAQLQNLLMFSTDIGQGNEIL